MKRAMVPDPRLVEQPIKGIWSFGWEKASIYLLYFGSIHFFSVCPSPLLWKTIFEVLPSISGSQCHADTSNVINSAGREKSLGSGQVNSPGVLTLATDFHIWRTTARIKCSKGWNIDHPEQELAQNRKLVGIGCSWWCCYYYYHHSTYPWSGLYPLPKYLNFCHFLKAWFSSTADP